MRLKGIGVALLVLAILAGAVGATWEVVAPIAAFGCWTCGLALALVLGREIRRARG
jgi:hypothetical protein